MPRLAVVRVAGDAASARYLRTIRRECEQVGIACDVIELPQATTQATLEHVLRDQSADPAIHGMLLQLPLPATIDAALATRAIDPRKDVDGVHPYNAGLLALGRPALLPNTPAGGIEILRRYDIPIAGRHAVVVGRSAVVGRPMALLLLQAHATVTIAHSQTPDLVAVISAADIVVAAAGRAGLITAAMLRPGAVVIDFGINILADGSMTGDVDFTAAAEVAGAITPVPGGTGPVTNVMLVRNVLLAARRQRSGQE